MKKTIITSFAVLFTASMLAQDTETLEHFDPTTVTPEVETFTDGGFYTGHNSFFDEEFAEKYEIDGTGAVHGVIAIHDGIEGTPGSLNASYRVYTVANSGLPGTPIASQTIPYADIPIDNSLFTVTFTNPATVTDEFFVSFNLGDYAHGGLGTKRIAITHAPDGTRPESDFSVFGRNAIRWHSHGAPSWKDYRTENFTDYEPAVYFSLFPVIELESMSVIDFENQASIGSVYPNPSNGNFNVPIHSTSGGLGKLSLVDMTGKTIAKQELNLLTGQNDYVFSANNLAAGVYVLLIQIPEGSIAQRVVIR